MVVIYLTIHVLFNKFMRGENNHIGSKTQLHVIKKELDVTDQQRTIQSKKLVKYYA